MSKSEFSSPCAPFRAERPGGFFISGQTQTNAIRKEVDKAADLHGKIPHSARHAMGRYLIEKTGNVAAEQRQLGHRNAASSLQYTRITDEEPGEVLDGREWPVAASSRGTASKKLA